MVERRPSQEAQVINMDQEVRTQIVNFLRVKLISEARNASSPEEMRKDTKELQDAIDALEAGDLSKVKALLERDEAALQHYLYPSDTSRKPSGSSVPADRGEELARRVAIARYKEINAMLDRLDDLSK